MLKTRSKLARTFTWLQRCNALKKYVRGLRWHVSESIRRLKSEGIETYRQTKNNKEDY